ncbi:MAG: hypothetical protein LKJ05_01850 [Bifidobacteriaceae bacterium]|nr:hypothetical protein [Bifidobacteriaceae bacterium]
MSRQMWFDDSYAGSHEASVAVATNDAMHLLSQATYIRVATIDGRVCGVAAVRVAGQPQLGTVVSPADFAASYSLFDGLDDSERIKKYLAADRADVDRLAHDSRQNCDAELLLFIVAPQARGHRVGARLYDAFLRHLLAVGLDSYYLYTDSECDYGFYEHKGLSRVAAHEGAPSLDGGTYDKFVYQGSSYRNLSYKATPSGAVGRASYTKPADRAWAGSMSGGEKSAHE